MIAEIEQRRAELETLCQRFGVSRLELFGSAAAGDFHPGCSDLDFLVEFAPQRTSGYADQYFGLLEGLEQIFGRHIDLVVATAIKNPYFRQSVDETRALLYAA